MRQFWQFEVLSIGIAVADALCVDKLGKVVLMYKYRTYKSNLSEEQLHGPMMLNIARAEHYSGPYIPEGGRLFSEDVVLEEPYIWKEDGIYQRGPAVSSLNLW